VSHADYINLRSPWGDSDPSDEDKQRYLEENFFNVYSVLKSFRHISAAFPSVPSVAIAQQNIAVQDFSSGIAFYAAVDDADFSWAVKMPNGFVSTNNPAVFNAAAGLTTPATGTITVAVYNSSAATASVNFSGILKESE